eukprot:CAMPEP_0115187528 /NCGR_PEP_ID=MMETSP0270-20121206/10540_1 /TAXON_ID=71861 /ORGANISM="Scrippsiella trochoidea, Strain CCMP3099" /LENGTH=409 /DNA_ID=CAMNT_0002600679 /DNA_START=37 /DNA_END=1266 /DNA_ORIENTATION=+
MVSAMGMPAVLVSCLVFFQVQSGLGQRTQDARLREEADSRKAVEVKRVTVDLDLPPSQRWAFLKTDPDFAHYKEDVISYISPYLSPKILPLVSKIALSMEHTFYADYAEEMRAIARDLNMTDGELVLLNLLYQIEGAFSKCELQNTTGPCAPKGPGLCSGLIANGQGRDDVVWQGRNMDWNFPPKLLAYVMQVDYKRGGSTLFSAVQLAGMVGTLHGIRKGGFSVQLNARYEGGKLLPNFFEDVLRGGKTPTHVMRRVFEDSVTFDEAEGVLSTERLVNPGYLIMAGSEHGVGAIVTRGREKADDVWHLYEDSAKDTKGINVQPEWFRLQTNYDHWKAAPSYDDRRTPGVAHAKQFLKDGVNEKSVLNVMTAWPTKNFHTDITSVMCPHTGFIKTWKWMPSAAAEVLVV